jgi:hypothetical protein
MIRERENPAIPGLPVLLGGIVLIGGSIYQIIQGAREPSAAMIIGWTLALLGAFLLLAGLFVVNPNEGKVLQLFGSYVGTVKRPGLSESRSAFATSRARV